MGELKLPPPPGCHCAAGFESPHRSAMRSCAEAAATRGFSSPRAETRLNIARNGTFLHRIIPRRAPGPSRPLGSRGSPVSAGHAGYGHPRTGLFPPQEGKNRCSLPALPTQEWVAARDHGSAPVV